MNLAADPLAPQPHFHLNLKVDNVNLPALNESMKAIAKVDVGRGTFRMVAEMAGKDGGFQGYVKPFFEDLDFNNNLFRHGFVRAFNPVIEGSVDPDNVLPSGKSADGKDVAEVKDEKRKPRQSDDDGPGAPTGRESTTKRRK
ncbi:MAG: hypothetical protein Q7S40_24745 [Opitutaceae bacterium]|nr:hypothetical protein [Opitutaceae bacterium]